jgi:hypothetical protein
MVWRTYKDVMLLAKDGEWKTVDLGLIHSSAAPSIGQLIIERLSQLGDVEDKGVSPRLLVSNWPPAFKEVEHQIGPRLVLRIASVSAPAQP